ncbi:ribosomal protein L1p/L10e family-domain-containing protein [Ephemerocybe angulata]|uniref:Ribosomal protein L1p/L10e family-domain-containing protein n=1 Tax=Ephemerocybe angulata TaxID=980116 RepID=A0A8H6HYV4_9AGAR|nr:ribosomal protein L1p/L10e family-domain-containing protein [Tulosesus angulatus]
MANELIDEHVSIKQCRLAIDALHAHESKKQAKIDELELISGKEPNIWLNVTVKKIPPGHRIKPVKVPVVHPLVDPRTTPICLITKDPQRQYKDLLETNNIKFISRVVGIEKLKGKFKPFEARRALLKENGMFLADERIIPLLPKLLGKKWFEAKNLFPVCLTRKDLKGELERAVSSTYMNQNQGTCTSIKIGVLSHTPVQIVANLQKALPTIAANIKDGWENIQALHIKTNSSVSLPIWSCSLDASEEGRWHGLEAVEETEDVSAAAKGKKRTSSSDEEESDEEEKPKKRSKNADGSSTKKSATKVASTPKAAPAKASSSGKAAKSKATKPSPADKPAPVKEASKPAKKASKSAESPVAPSPAKSAPKAKATPAVKAPEPKESKVATPAPKAEKKAKNVALEKKKEKVKVVKRAGKSAKSALLGKKAGQE